MENFSMWRKVCFYLQRKGKEMKSTVIIRRMPRKYSSYLLETMRAIAFSNHRKILLKNAVSGERILASVINVDCRSDSFELSYSEKDYCSFLRWCRFLCNEASWYLLVQVSYADQEGQLNDEFRICSNAVTLVASN